MARPQSKQPTNGVKRDFVQDAADRPAKKTKLLDSDDESDNDRGGVELKVNEEYARRFEHNKKREEKQRLEEKYGKSRALQDEDDDSEDSQEGVEEDDAGELITEDVDQEIAATLQALRSKDPRIYDSGVKFFRPIEQDGEAPANGTAKEPSMTLKEYHTKNLLEGKFDEEDPVPQPTYAQEQEAARQDLVKELKAAEEEDDDEDDFLVAKSKLEPAPEKRIKITAEDVENADKDPETFLSNFMAARAWVPKGDARFQPLESDDEEEEEAAEEWESAYNQYFEDTAGANEKLVTYARDAVAKTTVRREGKSGRAKAREAARAKREAERKEKEQELARLRKLKMDEMEQKVQKIRQTGGLKGRDFKIEEWKDVLEADWSDDQWDKEMQRRFGEAYYADNDAMSDSEDEDGAAGKKKKKPKKPKFDDDIDIKDIIPDFKDDEVEKPEFTLSDDDDEDAEAGADADGKDGGDDSEEEPSSRKSSKQRKQSRADAKSAARRDRRLIEALVNDSLQYEATLAAASSKAPKGFRYRETSPTSFGMTPRDILLASDQQLNQFAGLKKLAAFRDPAKKKKDKKMLSKKARLRQWRQEVFGDAEGPKGGFETVLGEGDGTVDGGKAEGGSNVHEGERKRKRKRKGKKSDAEA